MTLAGARDALNDLRRSFGAMKRNDGVLWRVRDALAWALTHRWAYCPSHGIPETCPTCHMPLEEQHDYEWNPPPATEANR